MIEMRAAHVYARTPPSIFGLKSDVPDLLQWLYGQLAEPLAECPSEGYLSLDDCLLLHGKYAFRDGDWLPETVIDFAPQQQESSRQSILGATLSEWAIDRNHDDGMHTAALFKSGSANYGHFLTDIAPKIVNVAKAGHRKVRFLVPAEGEWAAPALRMIAAAFAIEAVIEHCGPTELAFVRGVHFYSPVSRHNDGPRKSHALLEMRANLLDAYGSPGKPDKRIFIARPHRGNRRLVNAGQVERIFSSAGYEIVQPQTLSFPEQIRLFSSATHIAGTLGAGMANMIFSRPETEILMLDPGIGDRYFWDLACLGGQHFHWLFTEPLAHYTTERALAPMYVDPQLLRSALRVFRLGDLRSQRIVDRFRSAFGRPFRFAHP